MRRRPIDTVLMLAVGLVLLGGILGLADALIAPSAADNGQRSGGASISLGSWIFNPVANLPRMNILLVGADDRVIAGHFQPGRADTIMLLCVSPKQRRLAMFSLPRDFLVTIPEAAKHGSRTYPQKINHAYAFGGAPLIRSTVEHTLGLKIDYYLKTDLKTFRESVDMLGGVDIEVPDIEGQGRGMNYDDSWGDLHIHLKPGLQHLNGKQAEGFVRYRKSKYRNSHGSHFGITDAERASNQQIFLKAMIDQKLKLTNLPTLMRVGGHILRRLETDMEWRTAVGLMQVMRGIDSNAVLQLTVPIEDKWIGGTYFCSADPEAIQAQDAEIEAWLSGATPLPTAATGATSATAAATVAPAEKPKPKPAAKQPRPLRVRVLNGSGVPGAAKAAASLLKPPVYHLDGTGNAAAYNNRVTVIAYAQGQKNAAEKAADLLGVPRAKLKPRTSGTADLVITLGSDFSPAEAGAGARDN